MVPLALLCTGVARAVVDSAMADKAEAAVEYLIVVLDERFWLGSLKFCAGDSPFALSSVYLQAGRTRRGDREKKAGVGGKKLGRSE